MVSVSFIGLANAIFFIYIVYDDSIFSLKICHMKHSMHLGNTAVTILLALSFLGLVMFLSYIFITTTVGR